MKVTRLLTVAVVCASVFVAARANAQLLCWKQCPFIDVGCFDVSEFKSGVVLEQPGINYEGSEVTPLHGVLTFNPASGALEQTFTQTFPDGVNFNVAATIDPGSLDGTWADDDFNSGAYLFCGSGPAPVCPACPGPLAPAPAVKKSDAQ